MASPWKNTDRLLGIMATLNEGWAVTYRPGRSLPVVFSRGSLSLEDFCQPTDRAIKEGLTNGLLTLGEGDTLGLTDIGRAALGEV